MKLLALSAGMAVTVLIFTVVIVMFDKPTEIDRFQIHGDCSLPKRPNEVVTKDVRMVGQNLYLQTCWRTTKLSMPVKEARK
jgi:hypothetical protein